MAVSRPADFTFSGVAPDPGHEFNNALLQLCGYTRNENVLEAAGEGTKMADHFSPIFRPAFPSSAIISERSSPSRVRFATPNNGAPLTAPGRSRQHF